ncbi:hypothetical protein QAD02_006313 [Eretmocerus hayati]|uniref:Uncharacterized protein n=1 Tax=Eretmocerus hayati TaxID=131215 RepID=A0ACC2N1D3_9HYME|nr:hypothetical protein QAD02_006313 [Eretmocerus hayati]
MYFENLEYEEDEQDRREEEKLYMDSSDSDSNESSRTETKIEKFSLLLKKKIFKRLNDGQNSTIKILLRHGADIHSRNDRGETVLHNITGQGEPQQKKTLAEMMLKKGADVNAANPSGLAPLHYIIMSCLRRSSEFPLFELFCKYDVDINAHCDHLGTPLHRVASTEEDEDSIENVQKLLELILCIPTVDLNIRNKSGDTPLHVAMKMKDERYSTRWLRTRNSESPKFTNENCVIELLGAGADIFMKNSKGLVPFDQLHAWLMESFSKRPSGNLFGAKEALAFITQMSWPTLCAEHVLKYLNNEDLTNLIGAASGDKSFKSLPENTSTFKELVPKIQKTASASSWIGAIQFYMVLKRTARENV